MSCSIPPGGEGREAQKTANNSRHAKERSLRDLLNADQARRPSYLISLVILSIISPQIDMTVARFD